MLSYLFKTNSSYLPVDTEITTHIGLRIFNRPIQNGEPALSEKITEVAFIYTENITIKQIKYDIYQFLIEHPQDFEQVNFESLLTHPQEQIRNYVKQMLAWKSNIKFL